MATRSTIGMKLEDGSIKQIYCHWDGYPSNNGSILLNHYNTPEKVEELLELGNLSSLDKNTKPDEGVSHDFDNKADGVCVAYGRDRGETKQEPQIYKSSEPRQREEYNYLFKNNQWYVAEDDKTVYELLTEELIKEK